MPKKIILLIMVLLIIMLSVVLFRNPLLRTDKKIRENLFKELPVGTTMDEVIKYIESVEKWQIRWIDHNGGFYYSGDRYDPVGGKRRVIGEKSIRVNVGSYRIIFITDVVVHFGFDEKSELIEIWVRKDTDGL